MNNKIINVMIDLETLGTKPGCKILSIGAVVFGAVAFNYRIEFYKTIISNKGQELLSVNTDTVEWWNKQSIEARKELFDNEKSEYLDQILKQFSGWIGRLAHEGTVRVWGNAASFDLKILEHAYQVYGIPVPWNYRNEMCFRTLKNLFPYSQDFVGVPHNALDDAINQAGVAEEIFGHIERSGAEWFNGLGD